MTAPFFPSPKFSSPTIVFNRPNAAPVVFFGGGGVSPQPLTSEHIIVAYSGGSDDTPALLAAVAALPLSGGTLEFLTATYLVKANALWGALFNNKHNFTVLGNGAVIQVLGGEPVVSNFNMMTFQNCSDGYVENLTLDGNRDNRAINFALPAGAYNLSVQDSCSRLYFKRVRAINSPIDGITVGVSAANFGDITKYPTDITFEDCEGVSSVRCGLSPITSVRLRVIRGRYTNTNGSAPQCGIDLEPDPLTVSFGNVEPLLEDVTVSDNTKVGLQLGGPVTATNHDVVIRGLRGKNNGDGFANIGSCDGLDMDFVCGAHAVATRGIVDINSNAKGVRIGRGSFSDITAALAANECIYVHNAVVDTPELNRLSFKRVACKTIFAARRTLIDGYSSLSCTYDPELILTGGPSELRNASSESAVGKSLYCDTPDCVFHNYTAVDPGSLVTAIAMEAGADRSTLRNIKVFQRAAIPAGAVGLRYNGCAPGILQNFEARSAGVNYTPANGVSYLSGVAGALISGVLPAPNDISANTGDASAALQALLDSPIALFATALTANRSVTLSLTNAYQGARFRILRTGLGAFTLTVQRADLTVLKVMPAGTAAYVDVEFDGAVWVLVGYGTL